MVYICRLLFGLLILVYFTESCSPVLLKDGTKKITNLQLLNNETNNILLTINIEGRSNYYCKKMSTLDGSVGNVLECDDYYSQDNNNGNDKIREWSQGDTDTTYMSISSITNNNDSTATISMSRNNKQFNIDPIPFDSESDIIFRYFTINSEYTTFITLESSLERSTYAIIFANFSNNNYTIQSVTTPGLSWYEYDLHSVRDIAIYESIKVIELPLVCCLCSGYFIAAYRLDKDINNNQYNFTLDTIYDAAKIDKEEEKIYQRGYESINIYNLIDGTSKMFEPDLSSNSVMFKLKMEICSTILMGILGILMLFCN